MPFTLISHVLSIALGFMLMFSKRYSHLKLTQLYFFGVLALSLLYENIFFYWKGVSWYYYLYGINMAGAILFALAYWEVANKNENRQFPSILIAAGCVLLVPFLPLSFVTRTFLPFLIVDAAIALTLTFAFNSKNPFLVVWSATASYAVALDVLKFIIPENQVYLVLRSIEPWTTFVAKIALVTMIAWQPITHWSTQRLRRFFEPDRPELSLVSGDASTNEPDARSNDVAPSGITSGKSQNLFGSLFPPSSANPFSADNAGNGDAVALNPVLKTAAKMLTLTHKPYLSQEEAMFYLDLNEQELEAFMGEYEIRKVYLTSEEDQWFVRREAIEKIID